MDKAQLQILADGLVASVRDHVERALDPVRAHVQTVNSVAEARAAELAERIADLERRLAEIEQKSATIRRVA